MVRIPLLLVFTLCASLLAFSAELQDRQGKCTVQVPANWTVTAGLGIATSPDKKVSIAVHSPSHGLNSLTQVKQMAPRIYPNDKVTRDSGSEFEMEGQSQGGKPNVYRAVPAGSNLCIAEITYESGTSADAKAIIETLKSK